MPDAEPRSTRDELIRSAERTFARDGVNAASLREIARGAGTRNVTAIKYHFGGRDELVQALHDKHLPAVEACRNAMLDVYESRPLPSASRRLADVRALAAALVEPFANLLADTDGGPDYLRVRAALLVERSFRDAEFALGSDKSIYRWRALVDPYLDEGAVRVHRRFTAVAITINELSRRAATSVKSDHQLFVSSLVDVVTGVLLQPSSPATKALLAGRERSQSQI